MTLSAIYRCLAEIGLQNSFDDTDVHNEDYDNIIIDFEFEEPFQ